MGQKETGILVFAPIENDSAYSVSIGISDFTERDAMDVTEITIPAEYEGLPVTAIAAEAFMRCRALKNVTIPNSVKNIGKRAFSCSGLTSVTIPGSVEKFGTSVFAECYALTDVKLLNGITRIESSMFENCNTLSNIIIPASVTLLNNGAFSHCAGLKSITIPENVDHIGNGVFSGSGLEKITVAKNNGNYKSDGNCILQIDGEFLVAGCKTSVIPNGVKCIGGGAFFDCKELKEISIPESVIQIDECAFYDCINVTKITIPDSVVYVNEEAFYGWQKTQALCVNEQQSQKWKKSWKKGCKAKIEYR